MSNDTAKTITTNIVPVQGTFEPLPPYECINLIGPAGTPFFAPTNPNLDGVSITNSTINSTTIGVTTPALGAFTTASATNQPIGNNDLTTKLYVDSLALGISWKQPVVAATLANITLSGAQTIDTVSVVDGDRVLVKNQSTQANNGIYIVGTPWTRSPDANLWDELVSALVFVESGSQAGSAWYCPVQPGGTLGVTAITWNNFSVGGVYFAGTGLNLSGGDTFNITNTGVTAATYGSASAVPVIAVNQQGQITSASNSNIAIAGSQITSGTIDSGRISGDYSGITGVGTLTNLTVSNTITGSISGNAATATTATSATSATTATNLAGGATGSVPYQSGAGATTFLAAGSNGQVLTLASGVPSWATPTTGTVTSVGTAGTVNGLTLTGGPITGSGTVTLGGTLDLSAPPTIGNTTANTGAFTTLTASSSLTTPAVQATNSGGLALKNSAGTTQISMGGGGGDNVSINVSTNLNGSNAQIDISPTGTGHVHIKPTGAGSIEIAPTNAGTINNMSIGGTTAAAAKVTTLDITSTLALNGSTGTAGYVLTSNGASAPTWNANANGVTITDDTTTNATRYLTFSELTAGTETTLDVSSTKLTFNPSSGSLGVGTTAPASTLVVSAAGAGTKGGEVYIRNSSPRQIGNFAQLAFAPNEDYGAGGSVSGAFIRGIDTTGSVANSTDLVFGAGSGGSPTERMRITSAGLVGIGTSSPAAVTGFTSGRTVLQVANSSDNSAQLRLGGVSGTMLDHDNSGNTITTLRNLYGATSASAQMELDSGFITFGTGTSFTERMRIDSSGNILVGTTSNPTSLKIVAAGTDNNNLIGSYNTATGNAGLRIQANQAGLYLQGSGTVDPLFITNSSASGYISFRPASDTERVRINSAGQLLIGTTSWNGGSTIGLQINATNNTSNQYAQLIKNSNNAEIIQLRCDGGIANFSANNSNLSDERTKTDIKLANSYLGKICAIPVKTFKYKDQTDDLLNLGVIAQDVEAVAPELVDVGGFGETPEDGIPLKAIYQTDLQYALMKAIQELKTELDSVKAELQTLKGN